MAKQPDEIGSLWCWVAADQIAGLSDDDPVTTWEDLSATGADFTQATASKKPIYKTAVQNGLPVVRFDGSDDGLLSDQGATISVNDRTCIAVVAMASSPHANFNDIFAIAGASGVNFHFIARINDALGNSVAMRNGTSDHLSGDLLPVDGSFHIVSWTYNPSSGGPSPQKAKIWIDQVLVLDEVHSGSTGTPVSAGPSIGSLGATSAFLKGDIAELAFWEDAIAESDIAEVEAYLLNKWFVTPDSVGRARGSRFETPFEGRVGRARGSRLEIPTPATGLARGSRLLVPSPAYGRARGSRFVIPPEPSLGRARGSRFVTDDGDRVGRSRGSRLVVPATSVLGRARGSRLVMPSFDRIGRARGSRFVGPSPPPGTGGPLPNDPETPGGIDPETGRPVLAELKRGQMTVQSTSWPIGPRGRESWAHWGILQAQAVISAGLQWWEVYAPREADDPVLAEFMAVALELLQNERIFTIAPPMPVQQSILGSVSGAPVVSGAGQLGDSILSAGWTGTLLAGNLIQFEGLDGTFMLVKTATTADPTLLINPQIVQGNEPADGAAVYLGPEIRIRAKLTDIQVPEVHAADQAGIGLRLDFREVP